MIYKLGQRGTLGCIKLVLRMPSTIGFAGIPPNMYQIFKVTEMVIQIIRDTLGQ